MKRFGHTGLSKRRNNNRAIGVKETTKEESSNIRIWPPRTEHEGSSNTGIFPQGTRRTMVIGQNSGLFNKVVIRNISCEELDTIVSGTEVTLKGYRALNH